MLVVSLKVEGNTLEECRHKILEAAQSFIADQGEPSIDNVMPDPRKELPVIPTTVTQTKVNAPAARTLAPQAQAPKFPVNMTGEQRDSAGLPWDARIHSSNKELSKDGTWRKRRGVTDKAYIGQIEAERRGQGVATSAPATPVVPPLPTTEHHVAMPAMPQMQSTDTPVLAQIQPAATGGPAFIPPAPTPMPSNGHTAESFRNNMMNILTDLLNTGKIDQAWIEGTKAQFGGREVYEWSQNVAASNQLFEALVGWKILNKVG